MGKIVTIGLDGATWPLLNKFTEEGYMPNLKRICEKGSCGTLKSTLPPITGPAWVSFATGKNPGKHGCYDFILPYKSLNNLRPISSRSINGPTIYEVLDSNKKKYISINLPCSTPPRTEQITIGDLLTQGENFVFPNEIIRRHAVFRDYRITPQKKYESSGNYKEYISDISNLERTRFECSKILFQEYDWEYFFVLISATDWVQHIMYSNLLNEKEDIDLYKKAVTIYKEIDLYIGWFFDNLPKGAYLFMMSDHGFNSYKYQFNVNQWLVNEGYLSVERVREKAPAFRDEAVLAESRKNKLVFTLPLFLTKFSKLIELIRPMYDLLVKLLPVEVNVFSIPVLEKTTAYSVTLQVSNVGGIYINTVSRFVDGVVSTEDYERTREIIIEKLNNINRKYNKQIIKSIRKKEQIYNGDTLDNAPDIIFICDENYKACTSIVSNEIVSKTHGQIGNGHSMDGIIFAYGPDINPGGNVVNAEIIDISPTLLHILGIPSPEDMDGKLLKDIFIRGSETSVREYNTKQYGSVKAELKNKISALKDKKVI